MAVVIEVECFRNQNMRLFRNFYSSMELAEKTLQKAGYKKITDGCWRKGKQYETRNRVHELDNKI